MLPTFWGYLWRVSKKRKYLFNIWFLIGLEKYIWKPQVLWKYLYGRAAIPFAITEADTLEKLNYANIHAA